jgi:hypothetical protein
LLNIAMIEMYFLIPYKYNKSIVLFKGNYNLFRTG